MRISVRTVVSADSGQQTRRGLGRRCCDFPVTPVVVQCGDQEVKVKAFTVDGVRVPFRTELITLGRGDYGVCVIGGVEDGKDMGLDMRIVVSADLGQQTGRGLSRSLGLVPTTPAMS